MSMHTFSGVRRIRVTVRPNGSLQLYLETSDYEWDTVFIDPPSRHRFDTRDQEIEVKMKVDEPVHEQTIVAKPFEVEDLKEGQP